MPHVEIKCFVGKTEEQKQLLADKIAEDVAAIFGCKETSVTVAIKDVEKEDWKEQVWDKNIAPEMEELYKKPGYSCKI